MTNFTPSELKYVAETTIPLPPTCEWRIRNKGVSLLHIKDCTWPEDLDFKEDDTQFRALVEWCVNNDCMPHCVHGSPLIFTKALETISRIDFYSAKNDWPRSITAFTLVDCMIAAVLAHRGDGDD